jgi:flagellar protein FliL
MAERRKPIPEADAVPAEQPVEVAAPADRSWAFPLLLVLVVLSASSSGAWLAYSHQGHWSTTLAMFRLDFGADGKEALPKPVEYGQFMEIQGLVINPAESGGKRYLMLNLGLESSNAVTLGEIKQKEVVVRDTVLKVLGALTVDELANIAYRNDIKRRLRDAVNAVLGKGEVSRIYFTQYVLQ